MRMKLKRKQVEQLEPFKNTAEFVSKLSAVTRGQAGRQAGREWRLCGEILRTTLVVWY